MDVITVGLAFIGYYYKSFGCCLAGIIVGSIGYIGVTRTSNNMFSKILVTSNQTKANRGTQEEYMSSSLI